MAQSLAVKYRPDDFSSYLGQTHIVKILQKQIEKRDFTNCYIFAGPSGTGKTTIARAFSKYINNNQGSPIEIDAASNNGVESVRTIIDDANTRSIDSEYKIFIIDEAHMISTAGWNAFLKCIEEPPKYTIFMFCTTNPEKIPATINNRCMRFNLSKVSTNLIAARLKYISAQENFVDYEESCDFIAKLSSGGVRDAISMLEKCAAYDNNLSMNNVLECLGNFSYDSFFDLTNSFIDKNEGQVLSIVEDFYNSGKDLKMFIENYLEFVIDLTKYCIFKDMKCTKIPSMLEAVHNPDGSPDSRCVKYAVGIDNALNYYNKLVENILNIKNTIKYDTNIKNTVEAMFISICRN